MKTIDRHLKYPLIPNDLWDQAKKKLFAFYSDSNCLEVCKNLLCDFERVYPSKYRSDLEEFVKESNYEDFFDMDRGTVFVTTIHKSKGREFDVVYMMLNGNMAVTDEEKRKLYVGMTRAKNALYIHCNTNLFEQYTIPGITFTEDRTVCHEPEEISLQLTHRDVVLDFFKGKKELIFKLHSGMKLSVMDEYLCAEIYNQSVRVAKFSKRCREQLEKLQGKGYVPYLADVRFIVAWKGEQDQEETAVLLPNVYLKRT